MSNNFTANEIIARRYEVRPTFDAFAAKIDQINKAVATASAVRWFRLSIPARGVKVPSRRLARVYLKAVERALMKCQPSPEDFGERVAELTAFGSTWWRVTL